jgi:hypothetical protein
MRGGIGGGKRGRLGHDVSFRRKLRRRRTGVLTRIKMLE